MKKGTFSLEGKICVVWEFECLFLAMRFVCFSASILERLEQGFDVWKVCLNKEWWCLVCRPVGILNFGMTVPTLFSWKIHDTSQNQPVNRNTCDETKEIIFLGASGCIHILARPHAFTENLQAVISSSLQFVSLRSLFIYSQSRHKLWMTGEPWSVFFYNPKCPVYTWWLYVSTNLHCVWILLPALVHTSLLAKTACKLCWWAPVASLVIFSETFLWYLWLN